MPATFDIPRPGTIGRAGKFEHFGARPLKRAIQRYVEDPLSEKILTGEFSRGDEIEVAVSTSEKDKLEFRVLSPTPQAS